MGSFGQALFWTQAMAGVWMFAAVTTHGAEMYDYLRGWMFGAPTRVAVAAIGPLEASCPAASVPKSEAGNTLVVGGFNVGDNDIIDPEQYRSPATGKPYSIVRVTGTGGNRDFTPGTYYHLPEGVTFLPAALNAKTDSLPYVSEALYVALDRLRCVTAMSNGEVRVNKALLSIPRQRYWEMDRSILAEGLGTTGVHLQIVDVVSEKRTPWENDEVLAAAQKAHLTVPSPETYRAYVRLATGR